MACKINVYRRLDLTTNDFGEFIVVAAAAAPVGSFSRARREGDPLLAYGIPLPAGPPPTEEAEREERRLRLAAGRLRMCVYVCVCLRARNLRVSEHGGAY